MRRPVRLGVLLGLLGLLLAGAAEAQSSCGDTSLGSYWWAASGRQTKSNNCQGSTGFRCYPAESLGYSVEKTDPSCDPSAGPCGVRIHATATIPGLWDMIDEDGLFSSLTPWAEWYPCAGASCAKDITCGLDAFGGRVNFDNLDTWLEKGLSCGQAAAASFSVKIRVCAGSSCENSTNNKIIDIPAIGLLLGLGCPLPPPDSCNEPGGGASGAAGASCPYCKPTGGDAGCGVSLDGRLACTPQWGGGGAFLHYTAGGPGSAGLPGSAGTSPWQSRLGNSWSHDHAERIVIDNPTEGIAHVWLITAYGSFRAFTNLAAGSGLRLYQSNAPSDEYRQLYYDTGSGGWQLKGLDGSVATFRSDGQWSQTVLPSDTAHPTFGTYNAAGQLTRVDFPDGRSETYTYQAGGKLATITGNTVTGSPARAWTYTWSGDHLVGILRPDGTAWEFTYGTNGAPADGLSQVRLIGTDGTTGRVMAAFDYDAAGRVKDSWRGDPSFPGANAVDKQSFTYTGGPLVTQTVVAQVISASYTNTTTYTLGRDTVSAKGKILSLAGNCPTCGLPPNTSFEYNNPGGANPLLPSAMVDGRQIRTELTYDGHGRLLTRTEAKGVANQERTTSWIYDTNFPGLAKEIDQPSTTAGQTRKTQMVYDAATSLMTSRTISGYEASQAFSYITTYTYNGAGRPLTIDPPGYGTQDVTTFTYNVANTNSSLPDTRIDPVIGTASFAYDGLNRRTAVTDVNAVSTLTAYDTLNRVTTVTRQGAAGVPDLVTTYFYDCPAGAPAGTCGPFRDLRCAQQPGGNGIAYVYDAAGRLLEVDRKADCNPASPVLERTVYTLDGAGHRALEERKRLDAGTEVSDGKTEYVYTCHLDKMTQGKGTTSESVTEYCYDEDDNLKQVWDANHPRGNPASPNPSTQTYTYDSLNRLTKVSQPWITGTADTQYTYDVQDHLVQLTDAEGNVTTFTTSDRDLQTQQVSPVSGTTTYSYNEHSQLTQQVDARGVAATRTVDPLDRVTLVHSSDSLTPDVAYTYDTPCAFGKSRLCSITQSGTVVGYAYDRFGRVTQDGALAYQYDGNGNRTQITYPGGVAATYGYDFADRQSTLKYNAGAGDQTVVTSAKYLSSGPLTQLALANGLTEQHLFDARYFPQTVAVTGPTALTWTYTVDAVGNITQIADGITPRTYSYVDALYFLKQGDGPWGTRSWTYDRIGNRLTEMRGATTDAYAYTNHNPRLTSITLGGGAGTRAYSYDSVGNELQVASPTSQLDLSYDGANRLVQLQEETSRSASFMTYDGRNFLTQSRQDVNACSPVVTQSLYSSEGLLHGRSVKNLLTGTLSKDTKVLHFAGRPVGLLETTAAPATFTYLSVDHLGTPILETNASGTSLWSGGFEPFGKDWNGAQVVGEFLRFPGQWDDAAWEGGVGNGLYYNVNRWYVSATDTYTSADPIGLKGGDNLYLYGGANPIKNTDPYSLQPIPRACSPSDIADCQHDCEQRRLRYVSCQCFSQLICGGLLGYVDFAVAECKSWQKGCTPCPWPPLPVIDYEHGHGPCKPGQGHWHYFEYHQSPPPQCLCRLVRRFGGCL